MITTTDTKGITLTFQEKRAALICALNNMDEDDRIEVQYLANMLVERVKQRSPLVYFSFEAAVEVLSKIGIFLFDRSTNEQSIGYRITWSDRGTEKPVTGRNFRKL